MRKRSRASEKHFPVARRQDCVGNPVGLEDFHVVNMSRARLAGKVHPVIERTLRTGHVGGIGPTQSCSPSFLLLVERAVLHPVPNSASMFFQAVLEHWVPVSFAACRSADARAYETVGNIL